MNIKQSAPEGVYLGLSNKSEIVKFESYKERKNFNAIITAKVRRGINSLHKTAFDSELNPNK